MKSNDVIVNEVIVRSKSMKIEKSKRQLKKYGIYSTTFILSLFISIFKIMEIEMSYHLQPQLSYGTVIYANDMVSGYVSVGVFMFALGAIFTIICIKIKQKGG